MLFLKKKKWSHASHFPHRSPWFSDTLCWMERDGQKIECRWQKTKADSDTVKQIPQSLHWSCITGPRTFLSVSFEVAKSHPKELSRMVNHLILSTYNWIKELSSYFTEKITHIQDAFSDNMDPLCLHFPSSIYSLIKESQTRKRIQPIPFLLCERDKWITNATLDENSQCLIPKRNLPFFLQTCSTINKKETHPKYFSSSQLSPCVKPVISEPKISYKLI